jgi:hypothetical protein
MALTTFRRLTRQEEIRTDDREREHHAEAERYHDVLRARGEGDLEPGTGEGLADHAHHQPSNPDAGDAAQGAGEQGVQRTLEDEHAHQVSPAHPDGACYAQLVLALGGEHHEDQEDQKHARRNRELPEEQEDAREGFPTRVGLVYGVLLDGLGLKVALFQKRFERVYGGVRARGTLDSGTLVGDEDGVDPALLPYSLLQPLQRHDHRSRGAGLAPLS